MKSWRIHPTQLCIEWHCSRLHNKRIAGSASPRHIIPQSDIDICTNVDIKYHLCKLTKSQCTLQCTPIRITINKMKFNLTACILFDVVRIWWARPGTTAGDDNRTFFRQHQFEWIWIQIQIHGPIEKWQPVNGTGSSRRSEKIVKGDALVPFDRPRRRHKLYYSIACKLRPLIENWCLPWQLTISSRNRRLNK